MCQAAVDGWRRKILSIARVAAAFVAVLLGCAVFGTFSGCSAPDHTYIANADHKTYFKVPASWHEIDEKALKQTSSGPSPTPESDGEWVVAYDAAKAPSVAHLIASDTPDPIVYVSVRPMPTEAGGQLSLDNLRDLALPVTASARKAATGASTPFTDFHLISDSVLTPESGFRGVREVFRYRVSGGPSQTFDETVYTNKEGSKVYLMLLRCSSPCYQARRSELDSVVASFTVREA
jgi:hypothetical protein